MSKITLKFTACYVDNFLQSGVHKKLSTGHFFKVTLLEGVKCPQIALFWTVNGYLTVLFTCKWRKWHGWPIRQDLWRNFLSITACG